MSEFMYVDYMMNCNCKVTTDVVELLHWMLKLLIATDAGHHESPFDILCSTNFRFGFLFWFRIDFLNVNQMTRNDVFEWYFLTRIVQVLSDETVY